MSWQSHCGRLLNPRYTYIAKFPVIYHSVGKCYIGIGMAQVTAACNDFENYGGFVLQETYMKAFHLNSLLLLVEMMQIQYIQPH